MGELGFAIVGCGMIARFHCRALAEIPGTRIAALIGRQSGSAEKLRDELNLVAPCFTDLAAALGRPDVHAVIVCTPVRCVFSRARSGEGAAASAGVAATSATGSSACANFVEKIIKSSWSFAPASGVSPLNAL